MRAGFEEPAVNVVSIRLRACIRRKFINMKPVHSAPVSYYVHFLIDVMIGILGQVWYLVVSIPDLYTLTYFHILYSLILRL